MSKDIYEEIVALRSRGIRGALATIIARQGATPRKDAAKMLVYADGGQMGSIGGGSIEAEVRHQAITVMETGNAQLLTFDLSGTDPVESALVCGGTMDVYVEPITPDPTLFIFGAGPVSKALSEIAGLIAFRVAIIDDRPQYANLDRIPFADEFFVGPMDEVLERLPVNEMSYIFIASRSHQFDLICLRFAVRSPAKYIGMLGSGKKNRTLLRQLEQEGIHPDSLERVCVPVGIDIGSETPEEIAVSIAVELIAARKNMNLKVLRDAVHGARGIAAQA